MSDELANVNGGFAARAPSEGVSQLLIMTLQCAEFSLG